MIDGPGSVSTPVILVLVKSTEEGRGELSFPAENEPAKLGIEGVPKWVGDKGEGNGGEDVDKVESEGTAETRAATTRVRMAEVHMNA